MQTAFTPEQLERPGYRQAAGILKDCVHYGFCTAGCPTYVLTGDENDGPRGRIDLIKAMLEAGGTPDARTVYHLDRCLSCHSCMTTCAVNVDYMHLVDIGRAHIEAHYRRPWQDRLLRAVLAKALTRPQLMRRALRLVPLGRAVRPLLPARLRAMLDLAPAVDRSEVLAAQEIPAAGKQRHRVALLAGCAQQAIDGAVNRATIRLLQRHGARVVIAPGSGCCGSLPLHMGRTGEARALARANLAAWQAELGRGLDAIIVNASGCGTTVKDYVHLFAEEPASLDAARRITALARDLAEWVDEQGLCDPVSLPEYRVAYHDPCSMRNVQKVTRQPRDLLRRAGFVVREIAEGHFCCGSAGTYNIVQPELAGHLGERKAAAIRTADPDIVATGNIGCMVQIARHLGRPVVHTGELLDWATGGPMPPALAGEKLPDRLVRPPAEQATQPPAASAGGAIW